MTNGLIAELEGAAFERTEGETSYRCVTMSDLRALAERHGVHSREASAAALDRGIVPLRYIKNAGTLGLEGQARLLRSRVLVVGAGGIGGRAAELLARTGIGVIVIADPDVFEETNLNRQDFCCEPALGISKVAVVAERLGEINCDIEVVARDLAADGESLPQLLEGADVAIDALDTFDDRILLQSECHRMGVVLVHGAIAGTALQVTTIYPGDAGLEAIFPPAGTRGKARGIEVETGNPATTPTMAAVIQVQEAVKVILGRGETLRNRMLFLDMEDWSVELIGIQREPDGS